MNRIKNYDRLAFDIDKWLKDYYYMYDLKAFVVGVSGGIDSAVVSTLCAKTKLPTYVLTNAHLFTINIYRFAWK